MSRKFDSTGDRKEFENVFQNLQITDKTEKEDGAVSTAKTIQYLEKTTSKSQTFLFRERNYAPENAPSGIHINPVYDNKFIEKENDCHTKHFENTDDLEEDGNSTIGSDCSLIKNDFISNEDIISHRNKVDTERRPLTNVHESNVLLHELAPNAFTESQPVDRTSNETSIFEEHQHEQKNWDATVETEKYNENDDMEILDGDTLPDEPDYFDSEDEFSELNENSHEEMQMTPFYSSPQQGHGSSSKGNERYCSGVDQYLKFPIFMKSIRNFAFHNKFEVAESTSNGNCMFHAIADQLMINGEFNHTAESLRQTAIRYLRCYPYHSSGSHLELFLSSETWDDYLTRMEKTTEWGDQMMLKALSDSLILPIIVFNVYEDDIQQTEITPEDKDSEVRRPIAYLGHIGEFHYLSLRPLNWEWRWPYKALINRLLSFHPQYGKESVISMVQQRIQKMGLKRYIEDADLAKPELLLGDTINKSNLRLGKTTLTHKSGQTAHLEFDNAKYKRNVDEKKQSVKTYSLDELLLQENEDSLRPLIEDPLHTDMLTGIPMPHLSFMIRHCFPADMLVRYCTHHVKDGYFQDFFIKYFGSNVDGTDVTLEDCSKTRTMYRSHVKTHKQSPSAFLLHCRRSSNQRPMADPTGTHPGYCRLKLFSSEGLEKDEFHEEGNVIYLKAFKMPTEIAETFEIKKYYAAYRCPTWPAIAMEWRYRRKPFNWPTSAMMSDTTKYGCHIIQSAHPNSDSPSIEWKFNFSYAETVLCSRWTQSQRYAFFVFKIIVDRITSHLDAKLKNKHLKAVFFYACEQIPVDSWYRCLSGCILYVLARLVDCLNKKCIPHYFIPSNNIIDYYTPEEIETICVYVETARVFPIETIQFLVERHGYKYSSRLARIIFNGCSSFPIERNISSIYRHIFLPNTVRVTRFLAKLGFYKAAYTLMKDVYENFILNLTYELGSGNQGPSFMAFLKTVLQETRDKSSRLAIATIFDKECGTTLTTFYKSKYSKSIKEVVPFKVEDIIEEIQVPDQSLIDLSSLAAYLDRFGYDKYKQGNANMAGAAVGVAIRCIKHLLDDQKMIENEILDESLKAAILSEKESMNSRLISYYVHIYMVSILRFTVTPLINYMHEIERHCEKNPSMAYLVSEMWFYLSEPEKGREYLAKAESLM